MNTSAMTRRLLGAALAVAAMTPASAQAATLAPLKPCYISVTQQTAGEQPRITRERLDVVGSGFTPNAPVDISFDGTPAGTVLADANGNVLAPQLQSPYRSRGEGPFTLTAAERGNPLNAVSLPSRNTALALRLRPREAQPQRRIRYTGRGFTAQRAVWAHYLHKGKVRKTVRLVRRIDNPCGVFSVRRKQIPVKRPRTGTWTLQVDQQRRYSRAPDSVFVRVKIELRVTRVP